VAPGLPEWVYKAIAKALAKKKEERFANIDAFARALQGLPPSFQGESELLAEAEECVPVPRTELPTRAVRIHVSRPQPREWADSSPYVSYRIERGAGGRRSNSSESSAKAPSPASASRLPVPTSDEPIELLSEAGAAAAGQQTDQAMDGDEEEEEADAGHPQPMPGGRPSATEGGRRSTSIVAVLCLGAAVATNVAAVALSRWPVPDGPGVPETPDASAATVYAGGQPSPLPVLPGPGAQPLDSPEPALSSSMPSVQEPSPGLRSTPDVPHRCSAAAALHPRAKKLSRPVASCMERGKTVSPREKRKETSPRTSPPVSAVRESEPSEVAVSQPVTSATGRIIVVD
jgi:hypothetical protein